MRKESVKKDSPLARVLAQRTGDWLLASLDEHLEATGKFRTDKGWFHPSSLSHQCDAFLAFQYMGIQGKGKTMARGRRIMDNGTSRDEDLKRYLHESGLSILKHWGGSQEERELADQERSFETPHVKIRGACDDIVYNALTKEKYIFEFKTMNKDEWEQLRAPKPDHVIQVHPYMFGHGVLQAIIVYENKNTQAWKSYVKRFDGALWHSIELRLLNIMDLVEKKQLPWRTPVQFETSCQFYHTCSSWEFKEE